MVTANYNFVYPGTDVRKKVTGERTLQGSSPSSGSPFLDSMEEAAGKINGERNSTGNREDAAEEINDASRDDKKKSWEALMEVISSQREEILKKLKNGDTAVKIPIGSLNLTEEEWDKLIRSFDKAQEKIQESIRKENGESLPEKRPDSTVNGDKVFAGEDTGHDIKSLEELIEDIGIEGKVEESEKDRKTGE